MPSYVRIIGQHQVVRVTFEVLWKIPDAEYSCLKFLSWDWTRVIDLVDLLSDAGFPAEWE